MRPSHKYSSWPESFNNTPPPSNNNLCQRRHSQIPIVLQGDLCLLRPHQILHHEPRPPYHLPCDTQRSSTSLLLLKRLRLLRQTHRNLLPPSSSTSNPPTVPSSATSPSAPSKPSSTPPSATRTPLHLFTGCSITSSVPEWTHRPHSHRNPSLYS